MFYTYKILLWVMTAGEEVKWETKLQEGTVIFMFFSDFKFLKSLKSDLPDGNYVPLLFYGIPTI